MRFEIRMVIDSSRLLYRKWFNFKLYFQSQRITSITNSFESIKIVKNWAFKSEFVNDEQGFWQEISQLLLKSFNINLIVSLRPVKLKISKLWSLKSQRDHSNRITLLWQRCGYEWLIWRANKWKKDLNVSRLDADQGRTLFKHKFITFSHENLNR